MLEERSEPCLIWRARCPDVVLSSSSLRTNKEPQQIDQPSPLPSKPKDAKWETLMPNNPLDSDRVLRGRFELSP